MLEYVNHHKLHGFMHCHKPDEKPIIINEKLRLTRQSQHDLIKDGMVIVYLT